MKRRVERFRHVRIMVTNPNRIRDRVSAGADTGERRKDGEEKADKEEKKK